MKILHIQQMTHEEVQPQLLKYEVEGPDKRTTEQMMADGRRAIRNFVKVLYKLVYLRRVSW